MRRLAMLVVTTAALSVSLIAAAAPASAGEGCFTPQVKGQDTMQVCVLPFDPIR